jgi:hypothetical protein
MPPDRVTVLMWRGVDVAAVLAAGVVDRELRRGGRGGATVLE